MGSTYTTNGGIEKIGLGEQAGAWGTTTNNNFDIIDRLINGVGSVSLSSSGNSHDLTTSDGSLSDGMFRVITFTNASEACTITIKDESSEKLYFIRNSSGQTLTFRQGTGVGASTVSLLNNKGAIIFADGGGSTNGNVVDLTALFTTSQAIDNVVIGGTTPAAITGTTITATTSILPDAEGGADIGSTSAEFGHIYIADDKKIQFGSDQDVLMEFDADGTGTLLISGGDVTLSDDKKLFFGTDKDVSIEYDEDGNNTMLVTGDVVFADGSTDVDIASHDTNNGLKLGGTLVTATANELNIMDGVTATKDELNIMDGVTASTDEINKLDGVTRTTSQINAARSGTVTSVATGTGLTGGTITSSGTISMTTTLGAVGTYAMLGRVNNGTIVAGQTYSGSSLRFSGFASDNTFSDNTAADIRGDPPTGTWRAMGNVDATTRNASTLFLRIS